MQYLFEHLAVIFSAVTGALAAGGKRLDLFGVIVLAFVTAVGGGTLRDIVLDLPVFWVADADFVLSSVAAGLATFVLARFWNMPHKLLLVADALGLAFVTMLGADRTLRVTSSATLAVVLGIVTGVAGGILRDVLTGEIPLVFRKEIYLYATAAFVGALVYAVSMRIGLASVDRPSLAMWAGAAATLMLRLIAVQWKLSLPLFHAHKPS